MPMDIDKNKCRPETHSCYNCNEKGHLSQHCPKPQKQQVWSVNLTETDLKSLVAKSSSGQQWMHERSRRRQRNLRRVFRLVNSEIHALSDQQVLGLRNMYSRSTNDMLNPPSPVTIDLRTQQVMPEQLHYNLLKTLPCMIHLAPKRNQCPPMPQHYRHQYPHVCQSSHQLRSHRNVHWHQIHMVEEHTDS